MLPCALHEGLAAFSAALYPALLLHSGKFPLQMQSLEAGSFLCFCESPEWHHPEQKGAGISHQKYFASAKITRSSAVEKNLVTLRIVRVKLSVVVLWAMFAFSIIAIVWQLRYWREYD